MPLLNPPSRPSARVVAHPALPNLPTLAASPRRAAAAHRAGHGVLLSAPGRRLRARPFLRARSAPPRTPRRRHHVAHSGRRASSRTSSASAAASRSTANGSQARITHRTGTSQARCGACCAQGEYDIVHVHSPLTPVLPHPRDRRGGLPGRRHVPHVLRQVDRLHARSTASSRSGSTC